METRHLLVLCAVVGLVQAGKHDIYTGHSVYGVKVTDQSVQKLLHELEHRLNLDIWQHGVPGHRDALVRVQPAKQAEFLQTLDASGIEHYVDVEDVAETLEQHDREASEWRASNVNRSVFSDYQTYEEIDAYLEQVASEYDEVTLVHAQPSYQNRAIKYLKISTTNFEDPSKPIYFMTAMIHAREWVTTPVALYSIYRLVENRRAQDEDVLNDVDWIILPLVNPDGYEHSRTQRLWRKTRSYDAESSCYGVDGNRNFDKDWATIGVDKEDPCSEIYPGPAAFSEVEVRNMRDIMQEYRDRIQLFMDIHSYGNYVTYGYGDESLPPNAVMMHLVGSAMGAAMDVHKRPEADFYSVGNSATLMYETSGCAQDYATSIGIPFSFTLELPGYGYKFEVPPRYVDHINMETWEGIVVSARLARDFYSGPYTRPRENSKA